MPPVSNTELSEEMQQMLDLCDIAGTAESSSAGPSSSSRAEKRANEENSKRTGKRKAGGGEPGQSSSGEAPKRKRTADMCASTRLWCQNNRLRLKKDRDEKTWEKPRKRKDKTSAPPPAATMPKQK